MKIVGDHLVQTAIGCADPIEFDLFSRSAFNRYYYAAFLCIRGTLKSINPAWAEPTHQDIPVMLTGKVLKRLKEQIHIAESTHQITRSEGQRLLSSAITAASGLADLLISARETRRLADYEPEIQVARSGSGAKLGSCLLSTAQNWEGKVSAQSKTILRVYAKIGLI